MRYFSWALKHLNKSGLIIFDDIYWSKDMTKAWREICQAKEVNISMDLFIAGIVMKRPEQKKQHFILKY
jgi:predicted O-methyltransferase YrrM